MDKKIGVVVVCYNEGKIVAPTVKEYIKYKSLSYIVIVDNGSQDDTRKYLDEIKSDKVKVIYTGVDNGYARGNNIGLEYLYKNLHCEYGCITQPDVWFDEITIITLARKLDDSSQYGILTTSRIDPLAKEPTLQYITRRFDTFWLQFFSYFAIIRKYYLLKKYGVFKYDPHHEGIIDIGESPGAFFMMRLNVYDKIGGYFDPGVFMYNDETMLAIRINRIGLKVGYLSNVIYEHRHIQYSTTANGVSMTVVKWSLESKKYFQDNYLKLNSLQKFLLRCAEKISLFERFMMSKRKKRR